MNDFEHIRKIIEISQLFNEECDNHIELSELEEGDNATHFAHALCNLAPTMIMMEFKTGIENTLELNHLANGLIFQYNKKNREESK